MTIRHTNRLSQRTAKCARSVMQIVLAALVLATVMASPAHAGGYGAEPHFDITRVDYRHPYGTGAFVKHGANHWSEHNPDGSFSFEERYRSRDSVHLYDASRGTWIALDLSTHTIAISQQQRPFTHLYSIVNADSGERRQWRERGQPQGASLGGVDHRGARCDGGHVNAYNTQTLPGHAASAYRQLPRVDGRSANYGDNRWSDAPRSYWARY